MMSEMTKDINYYTCRKLHGSMALPVFSESISIQEMGVRQQSQSNPSSLDDIGSYDSDDEEEK